MERVHLDRVPVRRSREILRRAGQVDEGIESLVHPRIESLVGADDHREPLMPELMAQRPLLVFAGRAVRHEG